jgi:hypothetical protein
VTPPVSIFSPDQLQQIVNETIPTELPAGHRNAIVAGVDQTGASVVAGFTLGAGDVWAFQGAFRHEWTGENEVGARLIASW